MTEALLETAPPINDLSRLAHCVDLGGLGDEVVGLCGWRFIVTTLDVPAPHERCAMCVAMLEAEDD